MWCSTPNAQTTSKAPSASSSRVPHVQNRPRLEEVRHPGEEREGEVVLVASDDVHLVVLRRRPRVVAALQLDFRAVAR
jgi:hypothetical protein